MKRRARRGASAALLAVAALDAPPAQAQPMPSEAEFRFETAWNRHRQGGADNRRTEALVVVIAGHQPTIRVVESGTDRDFSMTSTPAGARTRVETRRWHRRWAGELGPPAPTAGSTTQRTLTLRLEADTCTTDVRWNREPASQARCPPTAKALELRCEAWRGEPDGELPGAIGWRCAPLSGAPRPMTLPWFIADRCIRAGRDPRGRLHVAGCPPPPGPPAP